MIRERSAIHQCDVRAFGPLHRMVCRERSGAGLTGEQQRVLERHHTKYRREGAALEPEKKKRLAVIVERLAALGTAFSQNVLADEQSYTMELDGEADLAGLPDFLREAAAAAAT